MNTNSLVFLVLLFLTACEVAWAGEDRKLVIEPRLPSASDLITISVTNSGCSTRSEVFVPKENIPEVHIRLTYLTGPYGDCLQQNPNPPDFETTVGPLPANEYNVGLSINTGAHGSNIVDSRIMTVVETQSTAILSDGAINGLFHDLQAPHRYFYVLETDFTTLVVWNTFDPDGNQLWVYGVGDLMNDGSSVVADAYINTSGGFLPNGEADDDVDSWGVIRFDLHSCMDGTVTYESDFPEFGSGQFSVVRLANSKQIGCDNLE